MQILAVNAGDHNNHPHNNYPHNFTFPADPGVFGPPLEAVHAYFAVSSTGRLFSSFGGIDPANVNNGTPGIFAVGELTSPFTEKAYPSVEMNTPPCSGGAVDLTDPENLVGCGSADHLISVIGVVIDAQDRLWIVGTGRPAYIFPNGSEALLPSSSGGPKLVGVDLSTDTVFTTILFSPEVALPNDSLLDDVRFDLRPNITSSGAGVAYITDASLSGQNAIVVVDLGTGDAWRRLQGNPRNLYSVPTALLRRRDDAVEAKLMAAVVDYGQTGFSDGMESDSNGLEANAVVAFDPSTGTTQTVVRDPRIGVPLLDEGGKIDEA
ncbi:hypothetical protein QBC45DRAFT_455655 [Copromyces sp. CBS 386.78]|nr:hypothetical protein QBC45DRAFT_455655 [Copromyces sp. CBS 386.78]